jgi:hypothetical protein
MPPFWLFLVYHNKKIAMSKGSFFTGQPIFNQVLSYIPRSTVAEVVRELDADRYYKSFKTHEHLVTMLYSIFNNCTSIREVTTGLLAWEHRIQHLGISTPPRRSTISDANKNRSAEVFEKIYFKLLRRYADILPDSRKRSLKDNLYIFDSTTISLFQEILKGAGLSKADGRRKGGIKVHTLLHAGYDVPTMIKFSSAASNDAKFLREVHLPRNSMVVFDKGYRHYDAYNRFTEHGITWVTRHRDNSIYTIKDRYEINDFQKKRGVRTDWEIELGHHHSKNNSRVRARMIKYYDATKKRYFIFISNNFKLAPNTIANCYQQRWQIETFFKRIKQNYPLQYFLGDNENAIKIQIWCSLIADLLIKVIKIGTRSRMSYSNLNSLIRLHLMTYMDLKSFLQAPEKSLLKKFKQRKQQILKPSLFSP